MSTPLIITPQTVRELTPALLAFAYRRVGLRHEAEDLVQETWFSALRSASTFEGRSSLRTWLTIILRRRIVEYYRRQHSAIPYDDEVFPTDDPALERLDQAAARRAMHQALAHLSDRERRAISMCDLDEVGRDQASTTLKVTRGHLRVLLHHGRQKLAAELRAGGIAV